MKSFKIEDKNFYQAILPVLEQCFEVVNHPDRYHRGIFYHLSKNWVGTFNITFFSFSKDGLCNPITSLIDTETDILYKFGEKTFAKMVEHYFSPAGDMKQRFFITQRKKNTMLISSILIQMMLKKFTNLISKVDKGDI